MRIVGDFNVGSIDCLAVNNSNAGGNISSLGEVLANVTQLITNLENYLTLYWWMPLVVVYVKLSH